MDRHFEGQVVLVTGGGKGIGLGIATSLANRGARVAISGRNREALDLAVSKLKGSVCSLKMDVRDENSVRAGVRQVVEWGGKLDIVVNNAGIGLLETPLTQTSTDDWRDVIETNLTGCYFVARAAWPHLVETKGQLLNVASVAGTQGFAGGSAYCASKYGLNGFTDVLKLEGAPLGIRVLSLCPGAVATDIWGVVASDAEKAKMMGSDQIGELAAHMLATPRNIDLGKWVVLNAASPWAEP